MTRQTPSDVTEHALRLTQGLRDARTWMSSMLCTRKLCKLTGDIYLIHFCMGVHTEPEARLQAALFAPDSIVQNIHRMSCNNTAHACQAVYKDRIANGSGISCSIQFMHAGQRGLSRPRTMSLMSVS